jgi:hypothetical protein
MEMWKYPSKEVLENLFVKKWIMPEILYAFINENSSAIQREITKNTYLNPMTVGMFFSPPTITKEE